MAEVHIIGQIAGGNHFPEKNLFCKWGFHAGDSWTLLGGFIDGQTHIDNPKYGDFCCWSHPVDIHYSTKGIQDWPKLHLQVYHRDEFDRDEIFSYGFCHVPSSPGQHILKIPTWRPVGSFRDQLKRFFLGGGPEFRNPEVIYSEVDRYRLHTETMGVVQVELAVILRNFKKFGVEF